MTLLHNKPSVGKEIALPAYSNKNSKNFVKNSFYNKSIRFGRKRNLAYLKEAIYFAKNKEGNWLRR